MWGRWWHLGAVFVDSSLDRGGLLLEKRTGRLVVAVEEPKRGRRGERGKKMVCVYGIASHASVM